MVSCGLSSEATTAQHSFAPRRRSPRARRSAGAPPRTSSGAPATSRRGGCRGRVGSTWRLVAASGVGPPAAARPHCSGSRARARRPARRCAWRLSPALPRRSSAPASLRDIVVAPQRGVRARRDGAMTLPPRCRSASTNRPGVSTPSLERAARALSDAYRAGGSPAARAARTQGRRRRLPRDPRAGDLRGGGGGLPPDRARAAGLVAVLDPRPRRRAGHRGLGRGPGLARDVGRHARRGGAARWCAPARRLPRTGRRRFGRRSGRWPTSGGRRPGRPRRRLVRDRRARAGGPRPLRPPRLVARRRHARRHRAGNDRGLRARPRGSRRSDRRRRLDARAVPPRRALPAARGRLVPLRDPARPQPDPSPCEGRRARLRGREVRLRRPHPLAPPGRRRARASAAPICGPGHVVLDLCTDDGLERRTVSKRDGADYRRARKVAWGDTL